jgi:SAM-dependent methyltransferase
MDDLPANFRPGAFAGAAEAYARFRPPYPGAMLDDLLARAATGHGALLDLATGPGRIALDMAPRFERVVGVDVEPDMIDVARAAAARRGIDNVTWLVKRAEDFEAPPGSFDLVTIGEAFHRLRQSVVARLAFDLLRPDGCLATLGLEGRFEGNAPWEATVREVADEYRRLAFPEGWAEILPGEQGGPEARSAAMRGAGFVDVEEHVLELPHDWSFEEIAGYLESTSTCSRRALGIHFEPFIRQLRSRLTAGGATAFPEVIRWGYTLARKPR